MNNIKKAVFYIIFKSKSTIFNMLGVGVLGTLMLVVFQQDQFYSKGTDYLILVFFVVLLGCTLLQANSIIIDLTVKDKMSKRMEFFLASGIDLKFIIKTYTIQILKASIIIPFIIFVLGYYLIDFKISFFGIIAFFISTVIMSYTEVLFFNTITFSVEKYKLFKNMVFFGNFFLIYISAMCANEIVEFVSGLNISMYIFIIILNIIGATILAVISFRKISKLDNESVVRSVGQWI